MLAGKDIKMLEIISEKAMLRLGELLGGQAGPGDLLFLFGDLGAGKTTLTKGIARGLGIDEEITSPTFQIKKSYRGRYVLNHLDLYRLENGAELEIIAPEEFIAEGVTVVEWGGLLLERFAFRPYLEISIRFHADGPSARLVSFVPHGPGYERYIGSDLFNAGFGN